MPATPVAFATKDNAEGRLQSGINASVLSIPLQSGQGANFPQPYTGSATSLGSSTTLNSTGISAAIGGSAAIGKWIWNKTDGSVAVITAVATDSVTTTRLLGGSDNTWQNSDVWAVDAFVATFAVLDADGEIDEFEQALVTARSADTLTVATGGRGYNGTVANAFSADDHVYLLVTSPIVERLKDVLGALGVQVNTDVTALATLVSDLASTTNAKGASLVGVEDAAGNYTATTAEGLFTEIDTRLDAKAGTDSIGFYGDGSDGAKTVSASEDLNPTTEFEYTTLTINASQVLGVNSANAPLVIKTTNNVTLNGTIDLAGDGGPGGAGSSTTTGTAGTAGGSRVAGFTVAAGSGGAGNSSADGDGAGGAGGSSLLAVGTAGSNGTGGSSPAGGAAPTSTISPAHLALLTSLHRGVACGAGGSGGGRGRASSANIAGGNGGNGGGALVMFVGGNLTLGASSAISVAGANGSAGSTSGGQYGGAGGGGGGGTALILVAGSVTNGGVTLTASGGSGGDNPSSGDGGAGGAGKILIISLSTGTVVAS
ncbi:MAG TPA: hypothetical protein VD866_03805 [Urbifossiella sp.]|nr:hypothetical protein [Urbifossiella sp.]